MILMKIDVLTLFPEMFSSILATSILGRAIKENYLSVDLTNFRDYADNRHHTVDDTPFGGGAGMVLKPQPIFSAMEAIQDKVAENADKPYVIMVTPQGSVFSQAKAQELATKKHLVFLCGHYEGFDERIAQQLVDEELSIGDYVLTGGELPTLVMIDAIARFIPGVLGNQESAMHDSFTAGLLEGPQYTKPQEFRGMRVPDILLSGHHRQIAKWRREQALLRTFERRPELLQEASLTKEDLAFLATIKENGVNPRKE